MVHLFLGHQSYPDNYRDVKNVTINIHGAKPGYPQIFAVVYFPSGYFPRYLFIVQQKSWKYLKGLNCGDICTLQDARTNCFAGHLGSLKRKKKDYLARGAGDMGRIKRHGCGQFPSLARWQDGEAWKGCWLSKKTPVSQAKNDYQPKQCIPLDRLHPLGPLNLFYLAVPATNTMNFH